jgi:hypothetical protein
LANSGPIPLRPTSIATCGDIGWPLLPRCDQGVARGFDSLDLHNEKFEPIELADARGTRRVRQPQ